MPGPDHRASLEPAELTHMIAAIRATESALGDGVKQPRGGELANIVIGRPVSFAGRQPDDALAMQRYRTAFDRLGVKNPAYVYEPVGAAFFYARHLKRDSTVLVADFGGGTKINFSSKRWISFWYYSSIDGKNVGKSSRAVHPRAR